MQVNIVTEEQLNQLREDIQQLKKILLELSKQSLGDALLTNQEAADLLNVSSKTLQNYRNRGLIEFIQVGRKVYYSSDSIHLFLNSFRVKSWNIKKGGVL